MFALDLFNNDHERRIAEGAVDQLEQRRIDDLAMKMDDLVARAKDPAYKKNPGALAALMKEFQKCKAERDSYYMVRNETMGYGGLGEQDQIPVGRMQPDTSEYAAARNRSVKYADPKPNYAGGHKTGGPATVGYKKTTNKPLVPSELEVAEAGIGQDIANKTEKMARATPSTPTSKVASTVKNAAKWLAGKGGPGREGPTYESQKKNPKEVDEGRMGEIDAMRQDLERMNDRQFYTAYGISKAAFQQKYRTLLKPALDEHGGGIGPKQHWQDLMQERKLSVGDPVIVTAPNEFEGKTGEIYDFAPSGTFVIVNLYNHGKHSMHLSDIAYNEYADQEQDEEDDWYDEELDESVNPQFIIAQVTKILAGEARRMTNAPMAQLLAPVMKEYNLSLPQIDSMVPGGLRKAAGEYGIMMKEGFQDFNKVEPYAVCLAGKPVKKFDYYEQARRFHDNWKQKLYREGNKEKADKITLMPLNLDESTGIHPKLVTVLKQRGYKGPYKLSKLPKWLASLSDVANSDDEIMVTGNDPEYDAWVVYNAYGPYAFGQEMGYQMGTAAKVIKDTVPLDEAGSPAQQAAIAIAMKKAGKKPKHTDEAYTPAPVKPPRSPRGFNKQGTGAGNKLADLNRKEWEEKKKKEQGVAETALNPRDPAGDYAAKRKALQDLGMNKDVDQQAVLQRRLDLDREAKDKGIAEDTGSWIVYDPETKQIKKRFKTHTAGKSYAQTHGLGFASSEFYFDRVKDNKEVAEGAMSNLHAELSDVYNRMAPGIERNRDSFKAGQLYDALEAVAEQHGAEAEFKRMMAGARNRAHMEYDTNPGGFQNWFWFLPFADEELSEEQDTSGVESAILRRIMTAHTDLLMKFGPEKVMQAAEEVAYNVGDVDEIGTSDVSAYVNQVQQILGVDDSYDDADEFGMPGSEFFPDEKLDEKWSQKYKSSINCANPKGFSQRAHCAGKKKK